ncbi:MAG TPA: PilX N-terminal domain-containing pilus assembly protein [Rhodanobacteraceae bacterium]|nr:PilX N-terminal domain-containing pilus assembly protein [Rhodanobacteraceae bacterium]
MNTLHPAFSRHAHGHGPVAQRGAALLVALILLVVITLVGLAAIGTTLLQNKAASNQFDRQVAFQSAEAALRAATALIDGNPTFVARNCQLGGVECLPNPFDDSSLPAADIHNVAAGSVAGDFSAGALSASTPQYVIESLGNWVDYTNDTGCRQTANAHNTPSGCPPGNAVYYRITARSGDPAVVKNRAVVTLQVIVKQG